MFGAKKRLRGYLDVVRPWAMGKDNRGWLRTDFERFVLDNDPTGRVVEASRQNVLAGGSPLVPAGEWVPIPEVAEYRLDPSHVIFPIVPYDITVDRLFLPSAVVIRVLSWNQKVASFNATLERLNAATERDTRWNLLVMLHVGLIGRATDVGLYDEFRRVNEILAR